MATMVRNDLWGALAFRGVLAILFGLAAVFWPGLTLVTLVYLFSAFILATGLITLILGLASSFDRDNSLLSRILSILMGVLEVGVGVYLLRHIDVSIQTFILLIGFVFLIRGVIDFVGGLFEDRAASHRALLIVGGLLSAIAGVVILLHPASGGIAFVWVLGLYALVTGSLLLALALDLKKAERRLEV